MPHLDTIIRTLGSVRSSRKTGDSTRLFFTVINDLACLPLDNVKDVLQANESVTDQVYERGFLGLTKKAQLKATEVRPGRSIARRLSHSSIFACVSPWNRSLVLGLRGRKGLTLTRTRWTASGSCRSTALRRRNTHPTAPKGCSRPTRCHARAACRLIRKC